MVTPNIKKNKIGLAEAIFWILIILVISLLFWRLFGSPTTDIVLAAFIGLLLVLWHMFYEFKTKLSVDVARIDERLKNIEEQTTILSLKKEK